MPSKTTQESKTTRKKTTARKTTAAGKKPAAKRKSPARKAVSKKKTDTIQPISAEERHGMIAIQAYYKAEAQGFAPGGDWDHWLEAEREVDAVINQS